MRTRTTVVAAVLLAVGVLPGYPPIRACAQDRKSETSFTPVQLTERTLRRRAVEAVIWGMPAVNYDLMLQEMLTKTSGKVNQVIYWGRPLDWRNQTLTPNPDTLYFMAFFNTKDAGPIVIDVPPADDGGSLNANIVNVWQVPLEDAGLLGIDKGKGGKLLMLPPDYKDKVPASGYYIHKASSNRQIVGARSLPVNGDVKGAKERLTTVKAYPLNPVAGWTEPQWLDASGKMQDTTPVKWEDNIQFWEMLHKIVEDEPVYAGNHNYYCELAALGIELGKPFQTDARMKGILEKTAKTTLAQMRTQSFADRRPERMVWNDRKWQWASLRFEDGDFNTLTHLDTTAREKWFYQAIGTSPAMFRRGPQAGLLYWLGRRDSTNAYLDGGKTYKLTVPLPVPAKLLWSVTADDTVSRSQIQIEQNKAALRSLFELQELGDAKSVNLYFGPAAPAGKEGQWIKTFPGKGWFIYFRIYGPEQAAFNGSWKPGDFEEVQ